MTHYASPYRPLAAFLAALVVLFVPYALAHAMESDGHDHVHEPAAVQVGHGVGDGHTDHVHAAGGSSLLAPWSARWWGLLLLSIGLTGLLSYGVWRYLQVPEVTRPVAPSKDGAEKPNDPPKAEVK